MPTALRDVGAALTCLQLLALLGGAEMWERDEMRLEAIKKGILERLGMPAPPVIRHRLDPESTRRARLLYRHRMAELTGNRTREEGAVAGATHLHLLDVSQGHQDLREELDPRGPYRYQLLLSRSEVFHRQLRVVQAELKLLKMLPASPGVPLLDATVPLRVSIYTFEGVDRTPQLLRNQELDCNAPSLDLTEAVKPWVAGPEATLRLELAFTANVSALLATTRGQNLVLEVKTQEPAGRGARRARRVRRARRAQGLEEECGKSDGKCCLRSLKVSFQDIGWSDWVIAPTSYSMRFCEGSCPHNYKPASMHAQIKARLHALSKATPAPCCVPAAYDPMLLMHYDGEGRLVSTLFEDMLVTRCHCA
ncbi:PREDICTED: growth/differentiation factor 15 [Mesitornis unicolor]|uniref:growth/differentiation factor 15 n=1 Tax=Mesitornis unicolor TaxID=54374 RepID=UPI0005286690|nr:PREDICTED: growth/differentiation factor 15 [Mesitornis unicolor]